MGHVLLPMSILSLLSTGAIFGFFYAWVCSTMWGLDSADPRVAVAAMQAMNASVQNAVFFPAFFLTPALVTTTAIVAARQGRKRSAAFFASSATTYVMGAFIPTALVNVPMNEALAQVIVPTDNNAAQQLWQAFSEPWQFWNALRSIFSGVALALTGLGIYCFTPKQT
ncbi:MAG: DUF1772 domain-containing protein [Roseobacter sp.]